MTREQFGAAYAATQLNTQGWSDDQLERINSLVYDAVAHLDPDDDLTSDIVKTKFEYAFDYVASQT